MYTLFVLNYKIFWFFIIVFTYTPTLYLYRNNYIRKIKMS